MLGKAPYPALEEVLAQIRQAQARAHYLDPADLPSHDGAPVPANVYVLAAALGLTGLGQVLDPAEVEQVVHRRWKKGTERNALAFREGLRATTGG
jgi:Pyruvate/2-oxoacid:ferredoxin oxidoreductase gamma subunit